MNKQEDKGSALIVGVILMSFFAILSMILFSLTGDTVGHTKRITYKNNSSLIADSVLQKVKYDINDTFTSYYEKSVNTTNALNWFTEPSATGEIGQAGYIYEIPALKSSPVAYFTDSSGTDWSEARFDVTLEKLANSETDAMRDYTITASAYFVDSKNEEIPGTRSTVQEIIGFGFQSAEVFNYLIHTGGAVTLYGPGAYFGEVKSNTSFTFRFGQQDNGRKVLPYLMGSVDSAGTIESYRSNDVTQETRDWKFYNKVSNYSYRGWYSRSSNSNSMSRPFRPSVRIQTQTGQSETVPNGDPVTYYTWKKIPSTGGGSTGGGSTSGGTGEVGDK